MHYISHKLNNFHNLCALVYKSTQLLTENQYFQTSVLNSHYIPPCNIWLYLAFIILFATTIKKKKKKKKQQQFGWAIIHQG